MRETYQCLADRRPPPPHPEARDAAAASLDEPAWFARARKHQNEQGMRWRGQPFRAGEIMTTPPLAVRLGTLVSEAVGLMRRENIGIVPVVDQDDRLRGALTDRDLALRVVAVDQPHRSTLVEEVMTRELETATPDESIHDLLARMGKRGVHRIPIVDREARLLGIVSIEDIARRGDYDQDLQEMLQELTSRRGFWRRLARHGRWS